VAAVVGSTCPAGAGADSLAGAGADSLAGAGADSLVADTPAGPADRSRLAGRGIEAAGVAGSVRSMRGLGGWEAGRRGCFAGIAAVVVALVVALGGGCGCDERKRGGGCRSHPLLAMGMVRDLGCGDG
jgi:hypothetical protein